MKLRLLPLLLGFAAACGLTSTAAAAAAVGDPAAPLHIAEWIKGKPVDLAAAKGKQVVVVEFWATWCGPCRTSIPHLTELQKKFKDVVFIGVSDEDADTVKPFVKRMGDKMDYTVAVDKDGKTSAGYMGAYGINGIPHAFIVDKESRVVWLGHPMDRLEETLAEVVAGKFDLAKSKKRGEAQQKMEAFVEAASRDANDPKLDQLGKELEALDAELGGIQPGKKFSATEVRNQAKFERLQNDYFMAMMAGNSSTNLDRLEQKLVEIAPKDFDLADFKEVAALNKDFSEYMGAASGRGDTNRIPELTRRLAGTKIKNFDPLLRVAWSIVMGESLKPRDLDLAASLAKRAVELSEEKSIDALFVYGRTLSEGGKVADAIKWHKKAIAAAGDNEGARQKLEAELAAYEEKLKQN